MPWTRKAFSSVLLVVSTCLVMVECKSDIIEPANSTVRLAIVAGDEQIGPAGEELLSPLVVRATDTKGHPLRDQLVNFRVIEGGGTTFAGASITDKDGLAKEYWTLGTVAGVANTIEVRAVDPTSGAKEVFAVFHATSVPGRAASVTVDPGAAQVPLGSTLQVNATLRDRFDNLISDRTPEWASASSAVADVSATGLVTAVALGGPVAITASSEGVTGSSLITVVSGPEESLGSWVIDPSIHVSCPAPLSLFSFDIRDIDITITAAEDMITFTVPTPLGPLPMTAPFDKVRRTFEGSVLSVSPQQTPIGNITRVYELSFNGAFTNPTTFSAQVSFKLKFTDVPISGTLQCTDEVFSVTGTRVSP